MPKIDAANVREHRAHRLDALIDAAETILASEGIEGLTAGAVAARAGIARNSIYRYFDSIDDLIELVVTQEFPAWSAAVTEAVKAQTAPHDQALAYVRTNLELAARGTHRSHAALSQRALTPAGRARVKDMHTALSTTLEHIVADLDSPQPELLVSIMQAVIDACIRRIDAGDDPEQVLTFANSTIIRLLAQP